MVEGLSEFNRRWGAVPKAVREAARDALEKGAAELVADMNRAKPIPEIEVAWTWGAAPDGSMALGTYGAPGGSLRITIYATATTEGGSFPAVARWFEFGTADRYTKSGKYSGRIAANPYFYPVYRVRRRRVKARITRSISAAIKRV